MSHKRNGFGREESMSISGQCASSSSQGREALDLRSEVFLLLERGHCCQTEIFYLPVLTHVKYSL